MDEHNGFAAFAYVWESRNENYQDRGLTSVFSIGPVKFDC